MISYYIIVIHLLFYYIQRRPPPQILIFIIYLPPYFVLYLNDDTSRLKIKRAFTLLLLSEDIAISRLYVVSLRYQNTKI